MLRRRCGMDWWELCDLLAGVIRRRLPLRAFWQSFALGREPRV